MNCWNSTITSVVWREQSENMAKYSPSGWKYVDTRGQRWMTGQVPDAKEEAGAEIKMSEDVWKPLKRVDWPTRTETSTGVVPAKDGPHKSTNVSQIVTVWRRWLYLESWNLFLSAWDRWAKYDFPSWGRKRWNKESGKHDLKQSGPQKQKEVPTLK